MIKEKVIYDRDAWIAARRARRAARCRYLVQERHGHWQRAGVHRRRTVAVAHAWWLSAWHGRTARVLDTWTGREEAPDAG